ncbi:hypothetical protein BDN70DRAFT_917194 [Pholiota conissans]|uniref:Uncharacterized protein n=1 Tax=Pholiota conissans TaxID=109636 RepID=A0A9P5ZC66_9AGAR|nr:hypothetical protein BDN70DRAFT_917194 [Pholiota conissans]
MAQEYYLPFNRPTLLFFPAASKSNSALDEAQNYVVMATIKGAIGEDENSDILRRENNIAKEMSTFYFQQYEITKAIESVTLAHIFIPLPPEVVLRGKGYTLTGKRKAWKYGMTLQLGWGEERVHPCPEKWIFTFRLLDGKDIEGGSAAGSNE